MVVQDSLGKSFLPVLLVVMLLSLGLAFSLANLPEQQARSQATQAAIERAQAEYEANRPQREAQAAATATAQMAQAQAAVTQQFARAQATATMLAMQVQVNATATAYAQAETAAWRAEGRELAGFVMQLIVVFVAASGFVALALWVTPKVTALIYHLKLQNRQHHLQMHKSIKHSEQPSRPSKPIGPSAAS